MARLIQKPRSPPGTAAYWGTAATKGTRAVAIFGWYATATVKRNFELILPMLLDKMRQHGDRP